MKTPFEHEVLLILDFFRGLRCSCVQASDTEICIGLLKLVLFWMQFQLLYTMSESQIFGYDEGLFVLEVILRPNHWHRHGVSVMV